VDRRGAGLESGPSCFSRFSQVPDDPLQISVPMARTPTKTLLAVAAAICLALAAAAPAAASFGQIGNTWGEPGFGPAQFFKPGMFGVDPVDGSVYTGDITADENSIRIQKLSPTGEFEASVTIPRKIVIEGTSVVLGMRGIAVDHDKGVFYLVESCKFDVSVGKCTKSFTSQLYRAQRIIAFKIVPEGTSLVAAGSFELPVGENAVYLPQTIAVDPSNGDLVLFGEDAARAHPVVQRIGPTGVPGARFIDTGNVLRQSDAVELSGKFARARSIAVGKDGITYAVTGGFEITEGQNPGEEEQRALTRAWRLPPNLSKIEEVPGFTTTLEAEGWELPLESPATSPFIGGPQLSVSPDGNTLYWKEKVKAGSENTAGSYLVRGYSLKDDKTSFLYGGGKEG